MINTIELKQFKTIFPTVDDFKTLVTTPLKNDLMASNGGALPLYIDDTKTFYSIDQIYIFLYNKYSEYTAVNEESKQIELMYNALANTLPSLYIMSLAIGNEALQNLSIENLFKDLERKYNEDADTKFAQTETTYTSTPNDDLVSGTFEATNTKEKNIINRRDMTIKIKEMTNFINKYNSIASLKTSGFVDKFVNSIEFSSMWEIINSMDRHVKVVQGPKGDKGDKGDTGNTLLLNYYEEIFNIPPLTDITYNPVGEVNDYIATAANIAESIKFVYDDVNSGYVVWNNDAFNPTIFIRVNSSLTVIRNLHTLDNVKIYRRKKNV